MSPSSDHAPDITSQLADIQRLIQQGQLAQAQGACNQVIESFADAKLPDQVLYLLALCLRLQKQYDEAIAVAQKLLQQNNQHARAQQELGYNFRALGKQGPAASAFYQASKLNPALLSAWQALLPIYKEADQAQAQAIANKQIQHLQSLDPALLGATDLMYEGQIERAEAICRQYLQKNKHSLPGLLLLAEIATRLKATSEAQFILETCVELAPDNQEAQYQLFKIYSKLGKFTPALASANSLLNKAPDNTFYRVAKATALVGVGELAKAIALYKEIIATNDGEANIYLLLGHAQKTAGNIKEAIAAYQKAYQHDASCGDAYWSLANTKTYQFSAQEFSQMQQGVTQSNVPTSDLVHLHFALGKGLEDQGQFDSAFAHYAQGNSLQRNSLSYSTGSHRHFIEHQIANFTPEFYQELNAVELGCEDPAPIFIVGMPRAGSTLLEQILASHSMVDGTMELHEILGLAGRLSKQKLNGLSYPKILAQVPKHYLKAFGEQFIEHTKVYRQSAPYFIDKMPNNFMHVGLIKAILPNAKIIDARRDPMACCFSGYKQLFGEGQEFSYSLDDIAQYYQAYVKLMDHWDSVFPGQILRVQHEDVVSDLASQVNRILDYCGLPFEQACIDFHKNKRAVKTPSAEQVRQPIYTTGLQQWKNFEAHLAPLKQYFNQS